MSIFEHPAELENEQTREKWNMLASKFRYFDGYFRMLTEVIAMHTMHRTGSSRSSEYVKYESEILIGEMFVRVSSFCLWITRVHKSRKIFANVQGAIIM